LKLAGDGTPVAIGGEGGCFGEHGGERRALSGQVIATSVKRFNRLD
jgi:hypothetical protein